MQRDLVKKVLVYLPKLIKYGQLKEVYWLFKYVPLKLVPAALAARLDRREASIAMKKGFGTYEVNIFLEMLRYSSKSIGSGLCEWSVKGRTFYANYQQFAGFYAEYLKGVFHDHYAFDWAGKTVLDIGGFIGDSALYFLEKGASKVIIYEPVPANIQALKLNLKNYENCIDVHQKAISQNEGTLSLSSSLPPGSIGFGIEKGAHSITCQGITVQSLLKQHQVDVIKMDCEGEEECLTSLSKQELQSVPYWIVETHDPQIYEKIVQKFETCNFKKLREIELNSAVTLLHFTLARNHVI